MKEYILEEESGRDELKNDPLIFRESEIGRKTNKYFNYKFLIILFSVLDFISLLLLIISIFVIKTKIIWLFFSFTLVFSIILVILVFFKIKKV